MIFPTVQFGLFFLIVLCSSWALAPWLKWQKRFLLGASYVFYGYWNWSYVPLLFGIALFAALVAQRIQRSDDAKKRKRWLVFGVIVCLSTLIYYKYTFFLLLSLLDVWGWFTTPPNWNIESVILPLGVSFFVFHAISLLGDVYRRKLKQAVCIEDVLFYVSFFPQLIAGPILRASNFMPQLLHKRNPLAIRANKALMLIVMGLFKKVVIANMLSTQLADPVFASPQSYGGWDMLLAVYGYAVQIYCDFSGYTDIAIGCALLLGFRFPKNFNLPYISTNPQEFWRRWHISLSTWLRDYLYIPLGGSRAKNWRIHLNLMITMLLGGLWHGAAWTFVVWGALHGVYLIIHRLWCAIRWSPLLILRKTIIWRWISRFLLFNAVCAAWIFFRSSSFDVAFSVFERFSDMGSLTLLTMPIFLMLLLGLAGQYFPKNCLNRIEAMFCSWPSLARGSMLALVIFVIDLLGPTGVAPFIYFQF